MAWLGLAWPGLAWLGLAWPGLAWPGLAWLGLAWPVLAWPVLAWLGLAWPGLARPPSCLFVCFFVYVISVSLLGSKGEGGGSRAFLVTPRFQMWAFRVLVFFVFRAPRLYIL